MTEDHSHKNEHTHHKTHHQKHEKEEEDEVLLDFSKVKSWFKGKKKSSHKKEEEHDDSSHHKETKDSEEIDWKKVMDFGKRYSIILLMLIPIILTIFIRLQPMYLPATDNWAESTVNNYFTQQIAAQINQQYPNLPEQNKNILMQNELKKFQEENKDMLKQQIQMTSQGFKDRMMYESGDSKYVYLGDIDSYHWLREARKVINTGYNCDEIDFENNICYGDTYTRAPIRNPIDLDKQQTNPYSYSIIYTYKIGKLFNPDLTIMQASFYVPLIYGLLTAILAFLIGLALAGKMGALISSIYISTSPVFLSRTLGSDNDPQTMFYTLIIALFFIYTFQAKSFKRTIIFGVLTGLFTGTFAWAWQGWWFIFYFIIGTILTYLAFAIARYIKKHKTIRNLKQEKDFRSTVTVLLTFLITSVFFVIVMTNYKFLMTSIRAPFWFMQTKIAALSTYWPNVLVTVAEFNPGSIPQIIAQMGGKLIFFLGMMGMIFLITGTKDLKKEQKYLLGISAAIYLFLSSQYGQGLQPFTYMAFMGLPVAIGVIMLILKPEIKADIKMAVLLAIWFAATTYAALKGVRFTLLMVGAFGISFSITLSAIYKIVSRYLSKELKLNDNLTKVVVAVLLLFILVTPAKAGLVTAQNYVPSVNDAWYGALTNIRDNSDQDAIINSWWDFGHWFKYLADRRVTLDGSSQAGPPLHWLGKLMTTKDERQSMGILRMLDCGSNNAFDELNKFVKDTPNSVKILDKIVTQDKAEAEKTLERIGLSEEQIANVIQYTHCEPPEDFFITSEDMVGKAGVWGHFGLWDFQKAEMYDRVKGKSLEEGKKILLEDKFNLTEEQAEKIYFEIQSQDGNNWISPWPGYLSGVRGCQEQEGKLLCPQSAGGQQMTFVVNLTNMDVTISANKVVRPTSVVLVTEDGTEEKFFEGDVIGASLVLIPTETGTNSLVVHPQLANSVFTRLFFLEGHGLKYFDKFDDRRQVTGGRIIVWKVDWEGKDANHPFEKTDNKTSPETEDPEVSETIDDIDESIDEIDELEGMNDEMEIEPENLS